MLFGGFPLDLDDMRWEQTALRAAIIGLCSGLQKSDAGGLLLSGLTYTLNGTGGVLTIAPGWVSWGGEPFWYPGGAGNGTLTPDLHFFRQDITLAPEGSETFEDGSVQNAYERRRVKLVATGVDYYQTADAELYMSLGRTSRLRDFLVPGPWVSVTDFLGSWSAPDGLKCRREPGGIIRLRGTVIYGGTYQQPMGLFGMCLLPEGFRPAGGVARAVGVFPFADNPRLIQANPNGNVALWCESNGLGTGTKVFLSDVTFSA